MTQRTTTVTDYWIGYKPGWAALYYANTDSASTICADSIHIGPVALARCQRWIVEHPECVAPGIAVGLRNMEGL